MGSAAFVGVKSTSTEITSTTLQPSTLFNGGGWNNNLFAFSPSFYYFFLKKNPSFSLYFTLEHECDTSSHTFNRKEWKEEKLVRGPRGPVWRWLHLNPQPSGDLFLDTCGLVGLREVYRGADAPIPVRVRLLPVDDDAEPLGDVHHYHQALL